MKNIIVIFFVAIASICSAQTPQDPATLQETAKTFIRQGDYENAIIVLNKALQLRPDDLQISKDLLFANYLKRDFAKAMELGKPLTEREDADVQTFQMLGLVYKSIAEEKEADKLYKKGLKKFPNEGVLYSEYGELLSAKDSDGAAKLWEKGVEADPNHSSNYYFLSKYYADKGQNIWSLLYAEMFLNMESFTGRSTEIKNVLLDQYKLFFSNAGSKAGNDSKKNNAFIATVSETMAKQLSNLNNGITPESLILIRTRFVLDWYAKYGDKFPFRLFEQQRQLLQEGIFEPYNYWLFGPAANLEAYKTWQQYHQNELNEFLGFIRSKVFKIPENQQYKNM